MHKEDSLEDIKVIHVTQKFWPTVGGGQTHVMNIARSLIKKSVETEVVCLRYGTNQEENRKFGFKIKYFKIMEPKIPLLRQICIAFFIVLMCFKSLKERSVEKQNIIHTHDEFPFFVFLLLKPFFKYKLVNTEHRPLMPKGEFLTKTLNKINYFLARFFCDYIIAVDDSIFERLKKTGLKKAILIENGININNFKANFGNREYITFIGKLNEVKGADIFLELMLELTKRGIKAKFLILGDGPLKETIIEKTNKYKINLKIIEADTNKLLGYLDKSIILINPQRIKAVSLATLESMAMGVINIKSKIGTFQKPIVEGKNGFLFDLNNIEELTNKTIYVLKNENKLLPIRKKAIEDVRKKYNLEQSFSKILGLYKNN
jgi:glycosyltransferase involved in cell wall biosynthesis